MTQGSEFYRALNVRICGVYHFRKCLNEESFSTKYYTEFKATFFHCDVREKYEQLVVTFMQTLQVVSIHLIHSDQDKYLDSFSYDFFFGVH